MSRTADNSTPQIPEATGFPLPWDEALKRAGSLDKLRPHLHMGQILACHGGLYSWPNVRQRSGPGYFKLEWWAHAYVQAGRLMFFIEEVMFGPPVQEHVFAYTSSIKLDSVAFDTFFPVADLPPATLSEQLHAEGGSEPAAGAKPAAAPHPGGRKPVVDWEMVYAEIFRLMNYHDEFSPDDPEWNAQARLEEAIADFCQDKFKKTPGETQIREHVRPALEHWRRTRSET